MDFGLPYWASQMQEIIEAAVVSARYSEKASNYID